MTIIAFCEREDDLAPMTLVEIHGMIVARARMPHDVAPSSPRIGKLQDQWRHVRSGGLYLRHEAVLDLDRNVWCYHYSSVIDGRAWLRAIEAWREIVDGRPRFEPAFDTSNEDEGRRLS
jgi:hypothetical protein